MRNPPLPSTFDDVLTESGTSLLALSAAGPVLLVFLRHWGCPFCRQTLHDLSQLQDVLAASAVRLVFVHMGTAERATPYFNYYGFGSAERISDPARRLYQAPAFALRTKAVFRHLFDPAAIRAFFGGITLRHGIEVLAREDRTQMPGVFLLHHGQVVRSHHPRSIADKPDFLKLSILPGKADTPKSALPTAAEGMLQGTSADKALDPSQHTSPHEA